MTLRDKFVDRFGESNACAIEDAALGHASYDQANNPESDPFRWALVMCIGWECMK